MPSYGLHRPGSNRTGSVGHMGEIFFDEREDAEVLVVALAARGYRVSWSREGFAGEDDADDRAWVLRVEPFDDDVVALVDAHGGWLPRGGGSAAAPLELPDAPRRSKRG